MTGAAATPPDRLPPEVRLNAWIGTPATSGLTPKANRWGAREDTMPASQQVLGLGAPADPCDWSSSAVGYGVLLPDNDAPAAVKAVGGDAPEAVRELLAARPGTVVLRWKPSLGTRFLRRYGTDSSVQDPVVGLSEFGTGSGCLPRYVLIVGGPDEIPWVVQYALETRHAVGRLPLAGDALANYISAMLAGWPVGDVDVRAPLVWTVSIPGDITSLMRAAITDPLIANLTDDRLPRLRCLNDDSATAAGLVAALRATRPALVVTSSHGLATGNTAALRIGLGSPVGADSSTVDVAALLAAMPGGAVWYSQACCSAGSDAISHYEGLLSDGDTLDTMRLVAGLGPTVAPAPLSLLGRPDPIRGFLGHVEPTFDLTLKVDETGQYLGGAIVDALSTNAFAGQPLGYAFADYRSGVGELHSQWAALHDVLAGGDTSVRDALTRLRLTAIDRQSLVLLGDPTVTLPTLPGAP